MTSDEIQRNRADTKRHRLEGEDQGIAVNQRQGREDYLERLIDGHAQVCGWREELRLGETPNLFHEQAQVIDRRVHGIESTDGELGPVPRVDSNSCKHREEERVPQNACQPGGEGTKSPPNPSSWSGRGSH